MAAPPLQAPLLQRPAASPTGYVMSPTLDTSRAVILLDGGSRLDLGIVRSLGLAGVPVHLLCSDSRSITTTSRYVTAVHDFPPRDASVEERLAPLCSTARGRSPRPGILPTADTGLQFQSPVRARPRSP